MFFRRRIRPVHLFHGLIKKGLVQTRDETQREVLGGRYPANFSRLLDLLRDMAAQGFGLLSARQAREYKKSRHCEEARPPSHISEGRRGNPRPFTNAEIA